MLPYTLTSSDHVDYNRPGSLQGEFTKQWNITHYLVSDVGVGNMKDEFGDFFSFWGKKKSHRWCVAEAFWIEFCSAAWSLVTSDFCCIGFSCKAANMFWGVRNSSEKKTSELSIWVEIIPLNVNIYNVRSLGAVIHDMINYLRIFVCEKKGTELNKWDKE